MLWLAHKLNMHEFNYFALKGRAMLKVNTEELKIILNKSAQGAILSILIAIFLFGTLPREMFYEYILKETMPFYSNNYEEAKSLKIFTSGDTTKTENEKEPNISPNEIKTDLVGDIEYISVFNESNKIDGNMVVGINDIVFQDEDEFGSLPDGSYKENLTAENIKFADRDYFLRGVYNKDAKTGIISDMYNPEKFLNTNLKEEKRPSLPQVLIFHTHGGTEYFADSNSTDIREGIVGAGEQLKYVLENKYGINAIHATNIFDMVDGVSYRDGSYERMEPVIRKILEENPSIKVVIDLHRDGIEPNPNLVTYIGGKPYAKLMFVNGVSAFEEVDGIKELNYLKNDYLEENLAFSFNMQIAANELYPDLTRKILLKPYRFSTHMAAKSLLVEVGSQYSTKEEVLNSMELLADVIEMVVFE